MLTDVRQGEFDDGLFGGLAEEEEGDAARLRFGRCAGFASGERLFHEGLEGGVNLSFAFDECL